jgi:hypothetical protein
MKGMSDIGYRIKLYLMSDIMSDSALTYRRFRYHAQSNIADHGYRNKCPPMLTNNSNYLAFSSLYLLPRTQNVHICHPCSRRDKKDCHQCRFCCSLLLCAMKTSQGIIHLLCRTGKPHGSDYRLSKWFESCNVSEM